MISRYLKNGETLRLDQSRCIGCAACLDVCPHAVYELLQGKAAIVARERCMECGACALNCPAGAIAVSPGVGCVAAILRGKFTGTPPSCGCATGDGKGCC